MDESSRLKTGIFFESFGLRRGDKWAVAVMTLLLCLNRLSSCPGDDTSVGIASQSLYNAAPRARMLIDIFGRCAGDKNPKFVVRKLETWTRAWMYWNQIVVVDVVCVIFYSILLNHCRMIKGSHKYMIMFQIFHNADDLFPHSIQFSKSCFFVKIENFGDRLWRNYQLFFWFFFWFYLQQL